MHNIILLLYHEHWAYRNLMANKNVKKTLISTFLTHFQNFHNIMRFYINT